jgi:hypothetical protein
MTLPELRIDTRPPYGSAGSPPDVRAPLLTYRRSVTGSGRWPSRCWRPPALVPGIDWLSQARASAFSAWKSSSSMPPWPRRFASLSTSAAALDAVLAASWMYACLELRRHVESLVGPALRGEIEGVGSIGVQPPPGDDESWVSGGENFNLRTLIGSSHEGDRSAGPGESSGSDDACPPEPGLDVHRVEGVSG